MIGLTRVTSDKPMTVKPRPAWRLPALLGGALCLLLPDLAKAQAYHRIAPNLPAGQAAASIAVPPAPRPVPASDQVILAALKGVAFVSGPAQLVKAGLPVTAAGPSGITAPGLPLLDQPEFRRQIAPFIGRPLTLAALNRIASLALAWYRAHRQPFVDITIPPQNINTGVVQIVVTEYRIGRIKVTGNRWFSRTSIRAASGLAPGQIVTLDALENDLSWLNQNPFRHVNAVFQPGAEPGTTNVDLETRDRLPLRAYAGYDNEGVTSLGRNEWNAGVNWGNAFGLGQILSYQYTRSFNGRFTGNSISDTIPLPWRDKLLIFGSYEREVPEIAYGFNETGHSGQASIRYVRTLPNLPWLIQDLQIGYDFKTTNSNLEFGGIGVFQSQAQINQFPLIYDATETDRFGQTAIENKLTLSPGGMTADNNSAAFQAIVPGAAAHYAYDRFGLTRVTGLPAGFSWVARFLIQRSNHNLLDSEELSGGGPGSVAGYPTDTALGSEGELIAQDLRAPAFSPARLLGLPLPPEDQAQIGLFWNYADLYQVHPIPDLPNRVDLASAGLDLHYQAGRYVDLQFDMGWQLRKAPGTSKRGGFGEVSLVTGF
jgi:hemolysin activation/secretion protein